MKARLVPVYFVQSRDEDFDLQLNRLKDLLADQAVFLDPVPLGDPLPEAEAVIFPQFLGEAYHKAGEYQESANVYRHGPDVGLGDRQLPAFGWHRDPRPQQSGTDPHHPQGLAAQARYTRSKVLGVPRQSRGGIPIRDL